MPLMQRPETDKELRRLAVEMGVPVGRIRGETWFQLVGRYNHPTYGPRPIYRVTRAPERLRG